MIETTIDGILNKRVMLEQPAQGYRVAVDTVLLAAAVPALAGDRVLDMGCGAGGAMLCLAARVAGVAGTGIDIQNELIDLCRRNIARNDFASGLAVSAGDVTDLPSDMRGVFDHVLANPPFHGEAAHDASPNIIKQTANTEKTGELGLWVTSAASALKPAGTFTLIHRADRRDEILSCLREAFGEIDILPLLPKESTAAKRIILRARKGAVFSVRECRPLVLHKPEGGYTDEADSILRSVAAADFYAV